MSRLQERASQLQNNLPFMEGREKGEMKRIVNMNCTIREFGFMMDNDDKDYACFTIDEDKQNFYFGGQVLTEQLQTLENEGYTDDILAEGLPVLFGLKMSKNKNQYVTVTFYPEPVTPK